MNVEFITEIEEESEPEPGIEAESVPVGARSVGTAGGRSQPPCETAADVGRWVR